MKKGRIAKYEINYDKYWSSIQPVEGEGVVAEDGETYFYSLAEAKRTLRQYLLEQMNDYRAAINRIKDIKFKK